MPRLIITLSALALSLALVSWAWAASPPPAASAKCVACHAAEGLADGAGKDLGPHQALACAACHKGAEVYPHDEITLASCRACHRPHNEEASGDLHAGQACQACHFGGKAGPHALIDTRQEASCLRCHTPGNRVGASAATPPAKSFLCLACHTATLSLADWPSRIALAVLVLGLLGSLGFWLSGGGAGPMPTKGHDEPWRIGPALVGLFWDGLLQRGLWRISPARWLVHGLIFLPMFARMLWAVIALILGRWDPAGGLTQALLFKNHPATALFFDLTGLLILAGVTLAAARGLPRRGRRLPGLPGHDRPAAGLLALVALSGFVVEAARMAMTGTAAPEAFVGAALSRLFTAGPGLDQAYIYLWYGHAICFAAFVAYLPFSRLRHILLGPPSIMLGAGRRRGEDHQKGNEGS